MKLLLITLIAIASLILVQGVEHSRLSRGITCELYYIQGQVDTAKSLDLIVSKLEEKKGDQKSVIAFVKRLQNYQLYVAQLDGIKNCATIEYGLVEIVYFRIKNLLAPKEESK
jgi:hypothetical protein